MIKKLSYIFLCIFLCSCQFFDIEQKKNTKEKPIASVYNSHLYRKDIANLIPNGSKGKDSILITKSLIRNWAIQQLLKRKAEENLSIKDNAEFTKLVQDYKQSLLVNSYKERLIKQQLDTLVSESEIEAYYKINRKNFRLNEELIKIKYLHFGNDFLEQKKTIRLFKSTKHEDLLTLENQELNFKALNLNDSTWIKVKDVLLKIPKFRGNSKEFLLKKSKFIQKKDSLGLYLVAVKNILKRNDIAPLNYISPTIKQMILHKRKLELIREIEKTFVNDAIQNKNFKEY